MLLSKVVFNAIFAVLSPQSLHFIETLEKRQTNFLFWSPSGQFIVLAGLRSMSGILEMVDTSDMTVMNQVRF